MQVLEQLLDAAPAIEELDRQLLAAKGVSAAEMARMLSRPCLAGMLAAAAAPLLAEPPARSDLARAIAAEGIDPVRARLAELYAAALAQRSQELTIASYCDAYLRGERQGDAAMLAYAESNAEAIAAEFQRRAEASIVSKPKRRRR